MGVAARLLTQEEALARWEAYGNDPELANDSTRWEMDAWGNLVVSPSPSVRHQRISRRIARQLEAQLGGEALVECPVYCGGVLVADVAWAPRSVMQAAQGALVAPPLAVEVLSPSNTRAEMLAKVRDYLQHGVQEVVLVELDDRVRHFGAEGERQHSALGVTLSARLDDNA